MTSARCVTADDRALRARRSLLALLALQCIGVAGARAQTAPAAAARTLLMLDFELIDSAPESPFPAKQARLAMISQRLRDAFVRDGLYQPVDRAPVEPLIAAARARENLLDCHGCERDIARAAGAERVLLGWVQRVSELILNINIEVRRVDDGKVVLAKSVDLRGNNDQSWQRGIDFMVRDMKDKKQGNR